MKWGSGSVVTMEAPRKCTFFADGEMWPSNVRVIRKQAFLSLFVT